MGAFAFEGEVSQRSKIRRKQRAEAEHKEPGRDFAEALAYFERMQREWEAAAKKGKPNA